MLPAGERKWCPEPCSLAVMEKKNQVLQEGGKKKPPLHPASSRMGGEDRERRAPISEERKDQGDGIRTQPEKEKGESSLTGGGEAMPAAGKKGRSGNIRRKGGVDHREADRKKGSAPHKKRTGGRVPERGEDVYHRHGGKSDPKKKEQGLSNAQNLTSKGGREKSIQLQRGLCVLPASAYLEKFKMGKGEGERKKTHTRGDPPRARKKSPCPRPRNAHREDLGTVRQSGQGGGREGSKPFPGPGGKGKEKQGTGRP